MDFMNTFIKSVRLPKINDKTMLYASYTAFTISILYIVARGKYSQIALAVGVALILLATTNDVSVSLLAGALFGLIATHYYRSRKIEDFADEEEGEEEAGEEEASEEEGSEEEASEEEGSEEEAEEGSEEEAEEEGSEEEVEEEASEEEGGDVASDGVASKAAPVAAAYSANGAIKKTSTTKKPSTVAKKVKTTRTKTPRAKTVKTPGVKTTRTKTTRAKTPRAKTTRTKSTKTKKPKAKKRKVEGFADAAEAEAEEKPVVKKPVAKITPPPDNGDRSEFFNLGKKYKLPSEGDDKEFHLDAGTTFLNAYKSLKPDQIAAMTKDTQDLMQTQKQLMSTLATLKPLITDGKDMMDMFKSYFGNTENTTT
jgi:hypothetical protein